MPARILVMVSREFSFVLDKKKRSVLTLQTDHYAQAIASLFAALSQFPELVKPVIE